MENKKKIIYIIESILNIIVSIVAIVQSIVALSNGNSQTSNIIFICVSALFLVISSIYLIILIKKEIVDTLWTSIIALAMSIVSITCFFLMIFDFNLIFFIIFVVEFVLATAFQTVTLTKAEQKLQYNHARRTARKETTCTIQISTEYLVKDSYTPEEAEKTINQLYSLHENEGFSLSDYEKIKAKIIKNTKKDD